MNEGTGTKKKGSGCGCGVVILLAMWLGLTLFVSGVFPVSKLLAAPFLCPEGTEAIVAMDVWASQMSDGSSGQSSSSDLYCVDGARRAYRQSYLAVLGITGAATTIPFLLLGLRIGRRSRKRSGQRQGVST